MKRSIRWLCPALFLFFLIGLIWFLHLFTKVDSHITYISWDTSARIMADGSEEPWSFDMTSNASDLSGTYRFTGTLPENLGNGSLVFEPAGLSITLDLDGRTIWQSQAAALEEAVSMSQVEIPLSAGTSGELTLTCGILDNTQAMFPPLVRFLPEYLETAETTAFANLTAFPAGASALALALIFGIFLLGLAQKHPDFSLIPLMLAVFGLILFQLVRANGSYFLPQAVYNILGRRETGFFVLAFLLVYLLMNRRRRFWNHLGIAAGWSAAAFLLCFLVSAAMGSYLADYVANSLLPQLRAGIYNGLLYWLSLWLSLTCAVISAFGVFSSFLEQTLNTQRLQMTNKSISDNYRFLKERAEERAKIYHEVRHQLTALDCLCQKQDYAALKDQLDRMLREHYTGSQSFFTNNLTINTILQDTSTKAKQCGISFRASVDLPEHLPFPDTDLCALLMNMLDNALEAAVKAELPQKRYLSFRMKISGEYLAVECENSFNGELKKDRKGRLLTTKPDASAHGFGCARMEEITRKYQGIIGFDTKGGTIFQVKALLLLPD